MVFRKIEDKIFGLMSPERPSGEIPPEPSEPIWVTEIFCNASMAKKYGHGFFELELELAKSFTQWVFAGPHMDSLMKKPATNILGEVERLGWKLEHVGYYYMSAGEIMRDKLYGQGEIVTVSG